MIYDQAEFELRCEWGEQGVIQLAPISDIVIIVDVLSFSTCVEIATNKGAIIIPYQWNDQTAADYAKSMNALLASKDRKSTHSYSLSPASMINIPAQTRLVLPSPNGAFLTLCTGKTPTLVGCLRNCKSIANFAQNYGTKIAIIPAGERWEDGSLRPALEDLIGAGAIISYLTGKLSPEAEAAQAVFQNIKDILTTLKKSSSGKELIARGFEKDVELAADINSSTCTPMFINNAYINGKKDKQNQLRGEG